MFIHENAYENIVCEMTAILSRPQCVNCKQVIKSLDATIWPFEDINVSNDHDHNETVKLGRDKFMLIDANSCLSWRPVSNY